jgi:2-phospho-L-lactate guanylyltransferase
MIYTLVPVKPLFLSKSRLSAVLSPSERQNLMRWLVSKTLRALGENTHNKLSISQTIVISRDQEILNLATLHHATPLDENNMPYSDRDSLNAAIAFGIRTLPPDATSVLILPADLPFITAADIDMVLAARTLADVVICGDRENAGTNALLLTPPAPFTCHYGINSYHLHLREAKLRQRTVHTLVCPHIQFDLDTESDWHNYQSNSQSWDIMQNTMPISNF